MTEAGGASEARRPVTIVTGGSRGIGYGIAEALVAHGGRVCVTGRDEDSLKEAVERLGGPEHALGVAGKAADEVHQADVVARTMEAFGRIDNLVNNAGTNPVFGSIADIDLAVVRKVFDLNVVSALGFAQKVWAAWQKEHGGAIVNVSSIAGISASPLVGPYGISKAAMINLTQQLAHEFAPVVRANTLAPAVIKTKFATPLYEGREQETAESYPMKRLGVPGDVAGAAVFLLSDEAAWITGQTLVIDGGLTLNAGMS